MTVLLSESTDNASQDALHPRQRRARRATFAHRIAGVGVALGFAVIGVFGVVPPAEGAVTVFGGTGPRAGHFTEATGIAVEGDGSVVYPIVLVLIFCTTRMTAPISPL